MTGAEQVQLLNWPCRICGTHIGSHQVECPAVTVTCHPRVLHLAIPAEEDQ